MIKDFLRRLFIVHWPRKLVAMISAVVIWFLVNQSITETRTITDVPVHIINLPPDKTVFGILPNGLLNKKISITITGSKSAVDELRSEDMEIVINAAGHRESWIATIDKRNLHSINSELDLKKEITEVSANDLFIKLSRLVAEDVPLTIMQPTGDPPPGYQFLDIWPKHLVQKVVGPEEQVRALKANGLELTFNLNRITQEELDALYAETGTKDEVSYKIPVSWKHIAIPFQDGAVEPLNDPRANFLRIDFLKQELIPLGIELPITIFFPPQHSQTINPQTYSLETNDLVQKKEGLKLLALPLYAKNVSHLFLNVVKHNLLLVVVAAPENAHSSLHWAIEFIDEPALEEAYLKASFNEAEQKYAEDLRTVNSEENLRSRFREYRRAFVLFTEEGEPLKLKAKLSNNRIILEKE
jgi:hypothetical protein